MNPLTLHARNYRSFEALDVDLPDGCVAILGQNGAGKSSIVNAIDLAIFGPESRSLADCLTEGSIDDLLLELELEHAGERYRVRRTFSPRGRGRTTLDFERFVDCDPEPNWDILTCESAKATQERVEQTIGLSRETFRASAFLSQGDGDAFTAAQPRDRKRILCEVLGLDRYDTLLQRARTDKNAVQAAEVALAARLSRATEHAAALPQLERDHTDVVEAETVTADQVADLERSHSELAVHYQEAREHAALVTAAQAELKAARDELEQLQRADVAATEADMQIAAARVELDTLGTVLATDELVQAEGDLVAAVAEHERAVTAHRQAVQQAEFAEQQRQKNLAGAGEELAKARRIHAAIAELKAAPEDEARCDRCEQLLAGNARALAIVSMLKDAAAHTAEVEKYQRAAETMTAINVPPAPEGEPPTAALADVRRALATAHAEMQQRARLEERIVQLQRTVDGRPSQDRLLAATEAALAKGARIDALGDPPDLAAVTAQGQRVAEQLRTARAQLDQHKTLRARLEERLLVARAAATEVAAADSERASLQAELDIVAALERAFSPDGIPALIVENSAIPYLETEANRILGELGGKTAGCQVELRTQAALKSGDGVRDTLDVIVCSPAGNERPYETFSGGEKTRLNLALRIALARLLAHRRGAESRLLVVDEPDGLDDNGVAALVDVLRGLDGDFEKLYVVSHVPALRDSFDTTLQVDQDGDRSRVAEAGVFEAVAA